VRTKLVPLALTILLTALLGAVSAAEDARLLRFADIHEDTIVFVYAGDIWTVPTAGGTATRLTTDEGMELFPKFSPDGKWIAFSGEYGGNRQVYVMPTTGGTPRQLTWYNDVGPMPPRGGFDYQVMDWTPDGKHVLFRGNRLPWGVRMGRPYVVPAEGGMETPLNVPESGGGMLSPDGKKLVYTPISREFRTWKRYKGGRAQNVWIYDLGDESAEPITDWEGTDNQPVWVGDTIYYTSDRDKGRLNLFAYDTASKQTRQVTSHRDFDVLWPSAGPRQVVYENGGWLWVYDPAQGAARRVTVSISGDFLQTVPRFFNVADNIDGGGISPSGKRAVFSARGELFTVPAEEGEARNISRTPGIRELAPTWSPDGKWIAYLGDRSGEYDLYVRAQDGSGDERRITTDCDTWRFPPRWSPDSKKLAFGDKRQRLRYVEVDGGKIVDVDRGQHADISYYRWSPDSRWLAYTKPNEAFLSAIWVHDLEGGSNHQLSGDFTNDYEPVFDPEGRYLYFISDRDYNLTFSGYEFNYFYEDPARVYAATLAADGPSLLGEKSDEEEPKKEPADDEDNDDTNKKKGKNGKKGDEKKKELKVEIDIEGFENRVVALPGDAGNYRALEATAKGVLFIEGQGRETELKMFSLEDEETKTVLKGIGNYEVSRDGEKLLYAQRGKYGIVDVKPGQEAGKDTLDTDGMKVRIDPRVEWKQIFEDGWRITRDWFYDPGMHGLDWPAMRELYAPLVEHVAHRADLDYILGELGGELNAGHFYVNWGDMPRPDRVDNGLLGADIVADPSGYFRVRRIFLGENWHDGWRSPLTESGVDVKEGDFILAVDGHSTRGVKNFYSLLEGAAGRQVTLRVNDTASTDGARDERVRPIARETNLRYLDWVNSRRALVDELSGGRIGYIHLPNTAGAGNRELRKFFYPQVRKDALIIDVRYNGGGFIPDRMIELVSRTHLSLWARRGVEPNPTPGYAHVGPKVCLINQYSASGGDAFPYYFSKVGLGKLIGMRTWGGLIGLSGNPGFVDGGSVSVPTFRFIDTEGNWAVEGVGVPPDIEVMDRPDQVAKGQDPTLERGVQELLDELRRNPRRKIGTPPPVKLPR
jgi:tricorn protease